MVEAENLYRFNISVLVLLKDTVIVLAITALTIAEGNTLEYHEDVFGTYTITLDKFGDYDLVTRETFEDTYRGNQLLTRILGEMGKGLAAKIDQERYDQLETASADTIKVNAVKGVLLMKDVSDLKAEMEGKAYHPDVLIVSPTVLSYMLTTKIGTTGNYEFPILTVDKYGATEPLHKGEVGELLGLRIIKTARANAYATTVNETMMVMIDSSRALGEVIGRPIDTTIDNVSKIEMDKIKIVVWMRIGVDELDLKAIGLYNNHAT